MDAATGHINPCNNDYGGLLSQWHIALAQETIANLYFYLLVLETGGLFVLAMFLIEMRTERKRRLQIAGGVVAQLFNQYAHARSKAYEAIRAHNLLVEDKEDSLDSLLGGASKSDLMLPDAQAPNPGLELAGHVIKPANTGTQFSRRPKDSNPAGKDGMTHLNDTNSSEDSLLEQDTIPLLPTNVATASRPLDRANVRTDYRSDISVADESETLRRQIETLQARLQNKTLRINELEDALTVSANKSKIPEL